MARLHEQHALEAVPLPHAGGDVVRLECRADRQQEVRAEAVVLDPGVLGQDELDLGALHGLAQSAFPQPQHVIRQGVSVQSIWISAPPFSFGMG